MSLNAFKVRIQFLDGTDEEFTWVTRERVADGVLHLFSKQGEYADEEHLGSYPLATIKSWRRTER